MMAGRALVVALVLNSLVSAAGTVATMRIATGPCVPSASSMNSAEATTPFPPMELSNVDLPFSAVNVHQPSPSRGLISLPTTISTFSTGKHYMFVVRSLSSLALRALDNETSYVGDDGHQTSICGLGTIFNLLNNSLSSDGLWVSASPNMSCRLRSVQAFLCPRRNTPYSIT